MSRSEFENFETKGLPWSPDSLPETWTFTSLNPLLESLNSGFACGRDQQSKSGLIHLRPMNISPAGRIDLSDLRYVPENAGEQRLSPNDVLFNNTNSVAWVGKTALIENDKTGLAFSNHMTRLRTHNELLESAFLVRQLNWLRAAGYFSVNCNKHVNQASISGDFLRNKLPIALPPLPEQRRIVARLEALEARSRRAREKLAAVPAQLAESRQSLLAAAFQSAVNSDSADILPLESLTQSDRTICYGVVQLGEETPSGVPCIRTSDLKPLALLTGSPKRIHGSVSESYPRTVLRGGEVLVSVRGTLGGVAVAPPSVRGWNISREVAMIALREAAVPQFIATMIAAPQSQSWLTSAIKGVAYSGINIADLKHLPIPIPPIPEQNEIVRRLNAAFAKLDAAARAHAAAVAALDRLDQSLLARAFSGRLVAQSVAVAGAVPAVQSSRSALKPKSYLTQLVPALLRVHGHSLALDQINSALSLLHSPSAVRDRVFRELGALEALEYFTGWSQTHEDGALTAAINDLLKISTLSQTKDRESHTTLHLVGKLPPISLEVEADARHIATFIEHTPARGPDIAPPVSNRAAASNPRSRGQTRLKTQTPV